MRLLVFERGFFRPRRHRPVHGVELGRLLGIRKLIGEGVDVTLVCERDWGRHVRELVGEPQPRIVTVPYMLRRPPTTLIGALRARSLGRFDALLLGDPDVKMLPALRVLFRANLADRVVIAAEGEKRERLIRTLGDLPIHVVANSELVARHWRGRPKGTTDVYYGIVDHERFHPPMTAREDDLFNVLLLAKLPSPTKNVPMAIEAVSRLPEDVRERTRLHLAGYIEDPPADLPEFVVAHRWIPRDEAPDLLRRMDVQIVPSKWESFSQAAVQGMLTGLPLVTSEQPVLTEKLDTGGGIACGSAEEYAAALESLARDPEGRRRMGAIARETALERYTWSGRVFLERHLLAGQPAGG
jgi:glycosyltransferase involved in cell wall biosynthesis